MCEIKKMKFFVNGKWLESETTKYMDIYDPSTGEVIAITIGLIKPLTSFRPSRITSDCLPRNCLIESTMKLCLQAMPW